MRKKVSTFILFFLILSSILAYSDVIVKYYQIANAIEAYEKLKNDFEIVYIPTKHNSDEANNFRYDRSNDLYGRDTSITLNMLRITSPKNNATDKKLAIPVSDQFFRMESSGIF